MDKLNVFFFWGSINPSIETCLGFQKQSQDPKRNELNWVLTGLPIQISIFSCFSAQVGLLPAYIGFYHHRAAKYTIQNKTDRENVVEKAQFPKIELVLEQRSEKIWGWGAAQVQRAAKVPRNVLLIK